MERVQLGSVLAEKYRIDAVLGEGGMGYVLAATHLQLDRRVAIKLLHAHVLTQSDLVERFAREARMMARITNDNVVRVLDVGKLEAGTPYIVMEYLEGQDLGSWIRSYGPLPISVAVDFALQVCGAVAEAHRMGIVHRDLKPTNLFVTWMPDQVPRIKVLDFGISKAIAQSNTKGELGLTGVSTMLGSPLYMSPEQLTSARDVDGRADIWSIGAILYEMLTGREPFRADSLPQLAHAIVHGQPPAIRSLRPEVTEALEQLILRCLAKQPTGRFQTASELAFALLPFGSTNAPSFGTRPSGIIHRVSSQPYSPISIGMIMGPTAASMGAPGAIPAPLEEGSEPREGETLKPVGLSVDRSRRRAAGMVVVIGVGATVAVVGLTTWLLRQHEETTRPPAAAGLSEDSYTISPVDSNAHTVDTPTFDRDELADAAPATSASSPQVAGTDRPRDVVYRPPVRHVPTNPAPPSSARVPPPDDTRTGAELFESRH